MAFPVPVQGVNEMAYPFMELTKVFKALSLDGLQDSPNAAASNNKLPARGMILDGYQASTPALSHDLTTRYQREVLPVLEAVFPQSCIKQGASEVDQLSESHRQLMLYAITNNLAGLGAEVPLKMIYDYIGEPIAKLLTSGTAVSSQLGINIRSPLIQSVAETYFRCAVEVGDARAVEVLLQHPDVKLDVNQQSVTIDGTKYTAIERSAKLQHLTITRLLLESGADPNKTYRKRYKDGAIDRPAHNRPEEEIQRIGVGAGALNVAVHAHTPGSQSGYDLVMILLQRGGEIDSSALDKAVDEDDSFMMEILLEYGLQRHHISWAKNRFLHDVAAKLEPSRLCKYFAKLYDLGYDFSTSASEGRSQSQYLWETGDWPPTLMDIMALRGKEALVRQLRQYGAPVTEHTIIAGIRSANFGLAQYLLDQGAPVNQFSAHFHTTAFAEAVAMQDSRLVQLMSDRMPRGKMKVDPSYWALLGAAAEIGDINAVQGLISACQPCDPTGLGYALFKAVAADQLTTATVLLEFGAWVREDEITDMFDTLQFRFGVARPQSLLTYALDNRNVHLVHRLLEHDATTHGVLRPAIEWNTSVLDQLLYAGGQDDENGSGLCMAVKQADLLLVKRLIDLGTISDSGFDAAIRLAIEMNALPTVKLLLRHYGGSLPEDALTMAMDQHPDLFDVVLQYYRRLQPSGYVCTGWSALRKATEDGRQGIAMMLIDAGVGTLHVAKHYRSGCHPIVTAIRCGNVRIVSSILGRGLLVDMPVETASKGLFTTSFRQTVLLVAIATKQPPMVQLILKYGANVNTPASGGLKRTPLQLAAEAGSYPIVQLLLERGAQVNAAPAQRSGLTAFQAAAKEGLLGVAELLLKHGADPLDAGAPVDGRCAIEAAAEHGRSDMVKWLLQLRGWPLGKLESALCFATQGGYGAATRYLEDAVAQSIKKDSGNTVPPREQLTTNTSFTGSDFSQILEVFDEPHQVASRPTIDIVQPDHNANVGQVGTETMEVDMPMDIGLVTTSDKSCTVCHLCVPPLTLSNTSALRRHQRTKHKDIFPPVEHVCGLCSMTFDRKDTLMRHKAWHDKQDYQACSSCGMGFRKDYMKVHTRVCKA